LDRIISHLPWHGEVIGFHALVSSLIVDGCGQYFVDIIIWSRKDLRLTAFRSSRGCFLSDVGWGYNVEVVLKRKKMRFREQWICIINKCIFHVHIFQAYLTE
jgi:hypothetical protein